MRAWARRSAQRAAARLARDRAGASAVEFAFITPILLLLFAAALEVPRAIATSHRLTQATSALADLASGTDYADISDVFAAVQVVAAPYSLAGSQIVLTAGGIYQDGDQFVARVCSSVQQGDQARAVGSSLGPPPKGSTAKGDRFVMAEMRLAYRPLFSFLPFVKEMTFADRTVWPVRIGQAYNGQAEVVLPGGKPCPP